MIHFYYAKDLDITRSQINKVIANQEVIKLDYMDFESLLTVYDQLMSTNLFGTANIIIIENFKLIENKVKENLDYAKLFLNMAKDCDNQLHIILNNKLNTSNIYVSHLLGLYDYFEHSGDAESTFDLLKSYCLEEGINISNADLHHMQDIYDNNYIAITNELLRLALTNKSLTINHKTIAEFGSLTILEKDFALFDYVLKKDKINTEQFINSAIEDGRDLISILSSFRSHVSFCLQVKVLSQKNTTEDISHILNAHIFRVKKASGIINKISIFTLMSIVENMAELDYKVKTGQLDPHIAIATIVNY